MIQDMINSETIWIQLNRQTQTYSRCSHADEERNGQVHVAQFITHTSATSCPHF